MGGGPLRSATRLAVRHRGGGDVNALLVVAWLGQLLGWRPLRCGETPDGGLRFEFDRPDGGSLEAFVIPSAGACDQSAILSIELTSGRDEYVVTREALDQARVQLPIAPARAVKLDTYSDADICVAALGPRGRDPLFARCLEYAGRLWGLEASQRTIAFSRSGRSADANDVVVSLATAEDDQSPVDEITAGHPRLGRRGPASGTPLTAMRAGGHLAAGVRLRRAGADLGEEIDQQRTLPFEPRAVDGDRRRGAPAPRRGSRR